MYLEWTIYNRFTLIDETLRNHKTYNIQFNSYNKIE